MKTTNSISILENTNDYFMSEDTNYFIPKYYDDFPSSSETDIQVTSSIEYSEVFKSTNSKRKADRLKALNKKISNAF